MQGRGLEPDRAAISWLRASKSALVSGISRASAPELLQKQLFGRAPCEAAAGAVCEALPKGL
jgi:hypothetical protein